MKLRANAPDLRSQRDRSWRLTDEEVLPDVQELAERALGVPQASFMTDDLALESVLVWQSASQLALGGIVQSIGIPSAKIFADVVKTFKIDPARDIVEKLEDAFGTLAKAKENMMSAPDGAHGGEAMEVAASTGISLGVNMVASMPVVGFVVRLAWNLAKLGVEIARIAKQAQDYGAAERVYPPSRYWPPLDREVLNEGLLAQVRTGPDWTNAFSPPSLGENVGNLPNYGVKRTDTGVEIFRVSGYGDDGQPIRWGPSGWLGMVPGTATLHAGVGVYGGKAKEIGSTLLPSSRGVGTWLWRQVTATDPLAALFTVHADVVASRWEDYIHELHVFIAETGALNDGERFEVMKRWNMQRGDKIFGWGNRVEPRANEWDDYHPTKICKELRDRQFQACDTLLIAYVDESFGAFKDAALKERFLERRRQLLEHPAVCNVRLADVIDENYKQALIDAGAGSGQCMQIRPRFTAGEVGPGFNPAPTRTNGGQGGLGGMGPAPAPRSAPILWLAAAAAAGFAFWKFRK